MSGGHRKSARPQRHGPGTGTRGRGHGDRDTGTGTLRLHPTAWSEGDGHVRLTRGVFSPRGGTERGREAAEPPAGGWHEGTPCTKRCPSSTAPPLAPRSLRAGSRRHGGANKGSEVAGCLLYSRCRRDRHVCSQLFHPATRDGSVGGAAALDTRRGDAPGPAFHLGLSSASKGEAPRRGKAGAQHLPSVLRAHRGWGGEKQQRVPAPPPRTPRRPNLRLAATQGCPPPRDAIPVICQAWHARG